MIDFDDVTACLLTRGNVPMDAIRNTLTYRHVLVYDNSRRMNLRTFGRYFAACADAPTDYIYFQDDDVIFREHWALVKAFNETPDVMVAVDAHGGNYGGYEDLAWTCSGAIVSKKLVADAWEEWCDATPDRDHFLRASEIEPTDDPTGDPWEEFLYQADAVFGILCPHRQVELPWERLYADDQTRMCGQAWQEPLKRQYVEVARGIRDGR